MMVRFATIYHGCVLYPIRNGSTNSIPILNKKLSHSSLSLESQKGPVSFYFILTHPGKKQLRTHSKYSLADDTPRKVAL